jgi:hypothetical protein
MPGERLLCYVIFAVDTALLNNLIPQGASGIALTPESEDILERLDSQIRSVLDRVGQGDEFDKRAQQAQEEKACSDLMPHFPYIMICNKCD